MDLKHAGIKERDDRGRTGDLHSLRHTFGTLLALSGVMPRTAMELMRHSDIRLTTNIYQYLEVVDTTGAVNQLPTVGSETAARGSGASVRAEDGAMVKTPARLQTATARCSV